MHVLKENTVGFAVDVQEPDKWNLDNINIQLRKESGLVQRNQSCSQTSVLIFQCLQQIDTV